MSGSGGILKSIERSALFIYSYFTLNEGKSNFFLIYKNRKSGKMFNYAIFQNVRMELLLDKPSITITSGLVIGFTQVKC